MKINKRIITLIAFDVLVLLGLLIWFMVSKTNKSPNPVHFNGAQAYEDLVSQVNFGPRIPGSTAHEKAIKYIQNQLMKTGWKSVLLKQENNSHIAYNILATRKPDSPVILLGAHYDSRLLADNDSSPENRSKPVPGANDGASGVAVLLELARSLPENTIPTALLFIDIEDNGRIPGWDWIEGSRAFAGELTFRPHAVIILDMIGDKDLKIYKEKSSDIQLTQQIWNSAKILGYETIFIPDYKYNIIDDHTPFLEKGIPAVDIIDLDYPYWHTIQDLPDKVSAASLQKVGDTILLWISEYGQCIMQQDCNEK